jgi:type I restriction enzyme S subunit
MEEIVGNVNLKGYSAYRESGAKWLGTIPAHWGVEKGKWLFDKQERSCRKSDEIVTCFRDGQVTLRSNRKTEGFTNALKEHGYQGIRKGDLVIHNMDAFAGAIGVSDSDGKSTPVYSACTPRRENTVSPYYYAYLLRVLAKNGLIESLAKGIRERSTDFRYSDFGELLLTVPPFDEQIAIVEFISRKTAQIDKAIAQKEKLIELLKERQQILIHKAVTQGLNPDVKMKDSGVGWIGEVPEHWEVKKLKTLIQNLESGVSVNASESEFANESEVGVLKTSCVYNYSFEPQENKKVFESELRRVACPVKANSIIISRMNAPELVGASGYVEKDFPNLFLPDRLWQTVFREGLDLNVNWLSKVFTTIGFRDRMAAIANGSSPSMKNISKGDFLNQSICVPALNEQNEIADFILDAETKVARLIILFKIEIEKLKEYKSTLIGAAITGNIKVD